MKRMTENIKAILASIKEMAAKYATADYITLARIKNLTKFAYEDAEYDAGIAAAVDAGVIARHYQFFDFINKEVYPVTDEEQAEYVKNGYAIHPETGLEVSLKHILAHYSPAK